jgi:hypothetical protein
MFSLGGDSANLDPSAGESISERLRKGATRCQRPALMLFATMTLYLHRAERADRLVTALGDLLSIPLAAS